MMEFRLFLIFFWCRVMYHDMPKEQVAIRLCTVYNTRILHTHVDIILDTLEKSLRSWFSVVSISPLQDHSTSSTKNLPKLPLLSPLTPYEKITLSPWGDLSGRIGWIEANSLQFQSYLLGLSLKGRFSYGISSVGWLGLCNVAIQKWTSWGLLVVRFVGCFEVSTYGNWQSEEFVQAPRETLCILFDKVNWQSLGQKHTHLTTIVSLFNFGGI